MCGITGTVALHDRGPIGEALLKQMCRTMRHRGPDGEGYYLDGQAALGMRRLSIIDLETGQQPMTNETRTVWVVFNGEIYNFQTLRRQLQREGHRFATQCDTEVIVHAYEQYGADCVQHFNGMFGFAVWDTAQRSLLLARDRLGIKPLYYWSDGQQIVFGSELKALVAHPAVPREVDPLALDCFLTLEYIPAPHTIFKGVRKLPPGHLLRFREGELRVEPYWEIPVRPTPPDAAACVEELTALIHDAVRLRLISDVPLGAFLSGGIDSSTIVASMSAAMDRPVKTFSIGFGDPTYNELPFARAVARHFGTEHDEAFLEPDISALAERLIGHLDEPFGDFSIFPTYLVSDLASRQVKVVLSGDGGDELFGGYDTYVAQDYDHRYYRRLPRPLRQRLLPALMARVPPQPAKKGLINKAKRFVEGAALPAALQHTRWMTFMGEADKAALYHPDLRASLNGTTATSVLAGHFQRAPHGEPLAQQQYVDVKSYLVDDILTKVDRMSMAASIEARVPLLDHRIVEFALNLPPHLKLDHGRTKVILRHAMATHLPDVVLNKPKQGFSIPLKHWLRGPLRPMMLDLLSFDSLRQRDYFQPQAVTGWVQAHLEARANHSHRLWALMVFEQWHRTLLDPPHPTLEEMERYDASPVIRC